MTTTKHETISETLPSVQCTSWCEHGDGHTDAHHPHDQFCCSEPRSVTLSRYPLIDGPAGTETLTRDYVRAQLYRMAGAANAHVAVDHSETPLIELSILEAEQLADALLELVKAARA